MTLPDEICLAEGNDDASYDTLLDAIDAASDQNHTTWLTDRDGKRIAKISPVDEIPDSASGRATDDHDKIMAGFERAYPALRDWSDRLIAGTAHLPSIGPRDDRTLLLGIEARLNTIGQRIGSSARDGEPGIIALLARMEALQAAMARQVGEVHRTLGLERDEDEAPVADATPFADEHELLAVTRDLLLQVLSDAGVNRARGETVWAVLRNLTLGIHPSGSPLTDRYAEGWPPAVTSGKQAAVHAAHCCSRHGCKYRAAGCPVARGAVQQEYPCEQCGEDPEGQSFAQWFAQFQGEHGWEADQYRSWLQAAWDAARSGRPEGQG